MKLKPKRYSKTWKTLNVKLRGTGRFSSIVCLRCNFCLFFFFCACYFCGVEGRLASICHPTQVGRPAQRKPQARSIFANLPPRRCRPAQPFLRCCAPSATAGLARPRQNLTDWLPSRQARRSHRKAIIRRSGLTQPPARPLARRQGGPLARHGLPLLASDKQ